jgi:hypothetical protein
METLGQATDRAKGYRYQVSYSKYFTSGPLKGITLDNEYVRFATWQAANEFAQKCDGKTVIKACGGNSTYISSLPILEAI